MSVTVTVYSTSWCPDCSRSKRVLNRTGITYEEIDIEKMPGAEAEMRERNGNSGKVPTIIIEGISSCSVLVEPTDRELGECLKSHQQAA